ncbi:unnamed protein product [Lymnaea stagnalis]|uniref:Uncharacterized protein n=1 Tax=Lymnaea stagnalis TaxID=6523 RepID=A0AAV2I9V7_LYMST
MKFLLLSTIVCASLVVSQQGPGVCLPSRLQCMFTDLLTSEYGIIALDFVDNLVAQVTYPTNGRTVFNLTERMAYEINQTTGQCARHPMASYQVYGQCLPASARLYTPNNSYVGLGINSLDMQAWQVDLPAGALATVAFNVGQPTVPIASQLTGLGDGTGKEINFFFNCGASADPVLFYLPSTCNAPDVLKWTKIKNSD